jgi:hypothetical protein
MHLLQLRQQQLHKLRHSSTHCHTHVGQGEGEGPDAKDLYLTLAQHAVAEGHIRKVLLLWGVAGLDELRQLQQTAAPKVTAGVRAAKKSGTNASSHAVSGKTTNNKTTHSLSEPCSFHL